MTNKVKFLRDGAVALLRRNIKNNIELYENKKADFADVEDRDIQTARNLVIAPGLAKAIKMPTTSKNYDADNSVLVYKYIRLNPAQACDSRIWVYLSHFYLQNYVSLRWPLSGSKNTEEKEKHIRNHYFVVGKRGLLRDNAIARLWWMGYIASRSKKFKDPKKILDILFLQSDVRSNLLERNLGMNLNIFDAVLHQLEKDYPRAKKYSKNPKAKESSENLKETLFGRENFRELMKSLNRIGGYRMLDALGFEQLRKEIDTISRRKIIKG